MNCYTSFNALVTLSERAAVFRLAFVLSRCRESLENTQDRGTRSQRLDDQKGKWRHVLQTRCGDMYLTVDRLHCARAPVPLFDIEW